MERKYYLIGLAAIFAMLIFAGCAGMRNRGENGTTPVPGNASAGGQLAPGDYSYKTTHGGMQREYLVHVPPSYNGQPTPVVIFLHGGLGGDESAARYGMNNFSDKYGFILLSPAGTGPLPVKNLRTWNAGSWGANSSCCGYAVKNNVDDVGFVSQMIDEVGKKVNVDGKRVYATGFSNGAALTYRLGCELANRIAAIAPASPAGLESPCNPSRPISVMHMHGTADPCIPYNGGRGQCVESNVYPSAQSDVDFWKGKDGCTGEGSVAYANGNASCVAYSCNAGTEVELCTLTGAGHAWPGNYDVKSQASEQFGSVSRDITFDQVWAFFEKHPMQ